MYTENQLAAMVRKGDKDAFEEVYLGFYKALLYYIGRHIHDYNITEDLTQEVFFYFWENRDKIDPDKGYKSFLISVARGKIFNYFRKAKYGQIYVAEKCRERIDADMQAYVEGHFNNMLQKDLLVQVNTQINLLPEKQRDVMILSRKKYLTNNEIAQKLEISVKTVEYRIMVALRQIKKNIESI